MLWKLDENLMFISHIAQVWFLPAVIFQRQENILINDILGNQYTYQFFILKNIERNRSVCQQYSMRTRVCFSYHVDCGHWQQWSQKYKHTKRRSRAGLQQAPQNSAFYCKTTELQLCCSSWLHWITWISEKYCFIFFLERAYSAL